MELFTRLFDNLLTFVYHCFDRIVIHGYLSGLSRPEQVVHFVRQVLGIPVVSKEALSRRTDDYRSWVEAYARNHKTPMEWAEKGLRKEDHVLPALRRMEKRGAYGVYFIFKSMEQGRTFRISVPKYPTQDPHHRIHEHRRNWIRLAATSWFKGKHQIRAGVENRRYDDNYYSRNRYRGLIDIQSMSDFLLGLAGAPVAQGGNGGTTGNLNESDVASGIPE